MNVPDDIRLAIAALSRKGLSQRQISSHLRAAGYKGVSRGTVDRVLEAMADKTPQTESRGRTNRTPPSPPPSASRIEPASESNPAVESNLFADDVETLALLRNRYAQVRSITDTLADRIAGEDYSCGQAFERLVKLEADLYERIIRMTPPPKPDPTADPAHLESRRILLRKMDKLVRKAEGHD